MKRTMKKIKLIALLLLLFSIQVTNAQKNLPIIHANSTKMTIKDGNLIRKSGGQLHLN